LDTKNQEAFYRGNVNRADVLWGVSVPHIARCVSGIAVQVFTASLLTNTVDMLFPTVFKNFFFLQKFPDGAMWRIEIFYNAH
jgi:hypothetical protein